MKIKIMLRGSLQNFEDISSIDRLKEYVVHEGCTCEEALEYAGLDYKNRTDFGFVAINDMRVPIESELHDGDVLKVFSALYGG